MAVSRLIRLTAAAELLDQSPRAVRARVAKGQLPCVRVGRLIFFDRVALERWIAQHTVLAADHCADIVTFPAESRR